MGGRAAGEMEAKRREVKELARRAEDWQKSVRSVIFDIIGFFIMSSDGISENGKHEHTDRVEM